MNGWTKYFAALAVVVCGLSFGQTAHAQYDNRNIQVIIFPNGQTIVVGNDRYVGATGFLPQNSTKLPNSFRGGLNDPFAPLFLRSGSSTRNTTRFNSSANSRAFRARRR